MRGQRALVSRRVRAVNVLAYVRVSTDEQADSGAGLAAQRTAIEAATLLRGWRLLDTYEDAGISGATAPDERPALAAALQRLADREAQGLIVAKVDRLSRSMRDFTEIMETARRQRWTLTVLDLALDTNTPMGEFVAHIIAAVAQLERRMISQRTKDALAEKRRQGVHTGRRSTLPEAVRQRIVVEREAGATYQTIVDGLNADQIPTGQGAPRWHVNVVRQVYIAAKGKAA